MLFSKKNVLSFTSSILVFAALLGGCTSAENPHGTEGDTAIVLTLDASQLSAEEQASFTKVYIKVDGDKEWDMPAPFAETIDTEFADAQMEYVYEPKLTEGTLKIQVRVLDAESHQVAIGEVSATIKDGEEVEQTVSLVPAASVPGCKLDSDEVQISQGSSSVSSDFLWDQDHYLMVYADESDANGDLMSVKLGANGKPLSSAVLVHDATQPTMVPMLAKTSNGYVVVWQEGPTEGAKKVMIKKLDANGNGTGSVFSIQTGAVESRPVVTNSMYGIVIAWMDESATAPVVHVGILNSALNAIDKQVTVDGGGKGALFPSLTTRNGTPGLLWADLSSGVAYRQHFGLLDDQLALTSNVELYASEQDALIGRVINTGSTFFAAWEDTTPGIEEIRAASINADGTAGVNTSVHPWNNGSANWANMAWDGVKTAVAYYQFRGGYPQIYLTLVDGNMVPEEATELQVTEGVASAQYPTVQFSGVDTRGAHYGVTWADNRTGARQLYFRSVVCN